MGKHLNSSVHIVPTSQITSVFCRNIYSDIIRICPISLRLCDNIIIQTQKCIHCMYTIVDIGTHCDSSHCKKLYNCLKNEGSSMHQTAEQMCLSYIMLSYQQILPSGGADTKYLNWHIFKNLSLCLAILSR